MAERSCPDLARLGEHLDGTLPAAAEADVVAHLDACATCQQALERLAAGGGPLLEVARQVGEAPPAPTLPAALHGLTGGARLGNTEAGLCGDAPALPPTQAVPAALAGHPRYRVLGPLGVGGMGAVFKAEHLLMERTVALKVIHHDLIDQPGAVERFRREVKAAARLTHPNIVAAYDAEQAGDVHFLVMEYVEGVSLDQLVGAHGPLPAARACDFVRQAALGLQHAFEQGMVHRDIKPHNLMLTPGGQVKVLDFGLARFAQESQPAGAFPRPEAAAAPGASAEALTQAGAVMGTPDFMAPEQIRDAHAADIRADVYSLGCTLYALLAGRAPFPEDTAVRKVAAHLVKTPRPLSEVRRDVPPGLAKVVARMMDKDPSRRYQTPAGAAAALLPFTAADRSRRARRRRLVVLAGLAVAAALAGGAAYWLWPTSRAADDSQRIQGAWRPVAGERRGGPMAEAELKEIHAIHFDGSRFSWVQGDGQVFTGTFRLAPDKNPKEIDVIRDYERGMRGVYSLEGDALKICVGGPGARRPAGFATDAGGEATLLVLRREPGPAAPPDGGAPPDRTLVGFWEGDATVNGEQVHRTVRVTPDGALTSTNQTADGESLTLTFRYTYADGTLTLSRGGRVEESGALVWLGADRIEYHSPWYGRVVYTRTGK
jgi:uncharacterized protein (TIGR03067 family)